MKSIHLEQDHHRKGLALGITLLSGALLKWIFGLSTEEKTRPRTVCYLVISAPDESDGVFCLGRLERAVHSPMTDASESEARIMASLSGFFHLSPVDAQTSRLYPILSQLEALAFKPKAAHNNLEERILEALSRQLQKTLFPNDSTVSQSEQQRACLAVLRYLLTEARKQVEQP